MTGPPPVPGGPSPGTGGNPFPDGGERGSSPSHRPSGASTPSLPPDTLPRALEALVEESPDGIVLFRWESRDGVEDFRRILLNATAERILRSSREALLGRTAADNPQPPLGARLPTFLRKVWHSDHPHEEVVEVNGEGGRRVFLFRGRTLGEQVVGIRMVEITDRELARREAARRERLLRGVAAVSERLLGSPWPQVLDEVVAILGTHAEVSRVYVFRGRTSAEGRLLVDQVAEWCAPGILPQADNPLLTGLDLEKVGLGGWRSAFEAGQPVRTTAREAAPTVRSLLEAQQVRSILILPIQVEGRLWGAVGFDECEQERSWSDGELEVLRSGAALLAATVHRERGQRELEAKEARLAAAVTASRDAFIIITQDGAPLEWNPAAVRILGSSPRGPVAPPEDVFPGLMEILASTPGGGIWFEVEGHRMGEEQPFPAQVTVTPIRVESLDLLALVVRDLTEEKRMEERLRQMEKLDSVGRLAGGVAHDFNNLLTVIRGNTDLALESLAEGQPPREELAEIARASGKGAALTQQLLAFSRRQVMRPVPLDLSRVVEEMARLLDPLIGDHIAVQLELNGELPPVLADAGQVEQVLMNLVLNARDAMPTGGRLHLRTARVEGPAAMPGSAAPAASVAGATPRPVPPGEAPGGPVGAEWVVLEVTDDGTGMTPEVQRQIFEPFFTTKPQGEGTGLGLATVYGVVKQSQGEIRVESEPGKGTIFRVYLPAVASRGGAT